MRFLSLLLLALIGVYLSLSFIACDNSPSSSSSADSVEEKKPNVVEYSITEAQYCAGCHAVIEEFYRFTLLNLHKNQLNLTLGHSDLMEKYCKKTEPFKDVFHPFYMHACLKIMQDHFNEALEPFLGSHYTAEYAFMNRVYQHKISVCEKIGACQHDNTEKNKKDYSDCEKCEKVVWTAEKMIRREQSSVINSHRVKNYARAICREMGLHHRYPLDIEEYCNDIFEEYGEFAEQKFIEFFQSNDYLQSNKNNPQVLISSTPINNDFRHKLCIQLTGSCAKSAVEKIHHQEDKKKRAEQLKKKKTKKSLYYDEKNTER